MSKNKVYIMVQLPNHEDHFLLDRDIAENAEELDKEVRKRYPSVVSYYVKQ